MISVIFMMAAVTESQPGEIMFEGPKASLDRLKQQAMVCGYPEPKLIMGPLGKNVIALPAPFDPGERNKFDCVANWTVANPRLKIGMIFGGAASDR